MVVKTKKGVKKKSSSGTGTALTEADTFVYEIPLVRSRSGLGEPNPICSDFASTRSFSTALCTIR